MSGKNLPLKFGLLALLVALSLWSMGTRGLQQGIDIRGGHSLTFEFEVREDDPADLPQQMLARLRERLDPDGLRNLEFRPQGNRIEIRMPAGRPESTQARDEYTRAMDRIEASNIERADVQRIVRAAPDERAPLIDDVLRRMAGGDAQLLERLREHVIPRIEALVQAEDAVRDARQEFDSLQAALQEAPQGSPEAAQIGTRLDAAFDRYSDSLERAQEARGELYAYNIRPGDINTFVRNYVGPGQREELRRRGSDGQAELERRRRLYGQNLDELLRNHPTRADMIRQVADAYERWSELRRELEDPADLRRLVAQAGVLEFRIAPRPPGLAARGALSANEMVQYRQILQDEDPDLLSERTDEMLWFALADGQDPQTFHGLVQGERAGRRYVLLSNRPDERMLRDPARPWSQQAWPGAEQGAPIVRFRFDAVGANRFAQLTSQHRQTAQQAGRNMAILLDGEVFSAPTIQATIGRDGIIQGNFTARETHDLARIINSGSLPARMNPDPVAQSTFGPAIGAENRERGIQAAVVGLVLVAGFMLVYYLLAGAIANVALVLNIILLLGVMSLLGAFFTLPGIAGLILTIGIAVDANVLIFERLREEQKKGQTSRMALKNAYGRATSAILDANLTTLLICLILGFVGTEEVRGFAITLGLGVVFSLFTALLVSRWIFQLLLDTRLVKKPVKMFQLVGTPRVNWMGKRYIFWAISAVLIVMGVASFIAQGSDIWGIEFSSGTQAVVRLRHGALVPGGDGQLAPPNDHLVRQRLLDAAGRVSDDRAGRFLATLRVETRYNANLVPEFLATYDAARDGRVTREEFVQQAPEYWHAYFDILDADNDGVLTRDELQALRPISYQITATETNVDLIRDIVREAFGTALETSPARERAIGEQAGWRLAGGQLDATGAALREELGVDLAGMARAMVVTDQLAMAAGPQYQDELTNYVGGIMTVVQDIYPPISQDEIARRIRDMRLQPGFEGVQFNQFQALGLGEPTEEGFRHYLVLVRPADERQVAASDEAFGAFVDRELNLLTQALEREEAIPAVNYDSAIAGDTRNAAIAAVLISCLAIIAYLWFRFGSIRWGLAAVVCLIHDVIIVVGLVAASAWMANTFLGRLLAIDTFTIDLAMVAAILTVIGYSVNDTIVVFDRIRENRGKMTTISESVINRSVNETLSRTILTSGTTLLVVLSMYILGGPGIHAFSYALLVGILFGTYSSVAIASPILLGIRHAVAIRTPGKEPEAAAVR